MEHKLVQLHCIVLLTDAAQVACRKSSIVWFWCVACTEGAFQRLHLHCHNLKNDETMSSSVPAIVVLLVLPASLGWYWPNQFRIGSLNTRNHIRMKKAKHPSSIYRFLSHLQEGSVSHDQSCHKSRQTNLNAFCTWKCLSYKFKSASGCGRKSPPTTANN